eukprot:2707102-Pyramimonas_sp.AAC.1
MLSPEDANKLEHDNRLALAALALSAFFLQAKTPAILEHPLASRLWRTREIRSLAYQAGVLLVKLDGRQFFEQTARSPLA